MPPQGMPQQAPTCSLQRHPSACSAGAICCINTKGAPAYPGLSSSAYTCSLVLCALPRQQRLFESSPAAAATASCQILQEAPRPYWSAGTSQASYFAA